MRGIIYNKFFNRRLTQTYADNTQEIYYFYQGDPFDSAQNRPSQPKTSCLSGINVSVSVCVRLRQSSERSEWAVNSIRSYGVLE